MSYNPYYSPSGLDLILLSIEEQGLSYEYNTLCFWATKDGEIYTASDSGCSCPTPFEQYASNTQEEALQKLERVRTPKHAVEIFKGWGAHTNCTCTEAYLRDWLDKHAHSTKRSRKKDDQKTFMEFSFEKGETKRIEIKKVTTLSPKVSKVVLHIDQIDGGGHLLIINETLWNVDTDKLKEIKIVKEQQE